MRVSVVCLSSASATLMAFQRLTDWAAELHLAYAWATSNAGRAKHWQALPLHKVRRAILGVHFAQTEPFVLHELRRLGVLRVLPDTEGVFHPKIVLGMKGAERRAIMGSSNFTTSGFSGNTELNLEVSGLANAPLLEDLAAFIDAQWRHPLAFEPPDTWLDAYESAHKRRPRPPRIAWRARKPNVISSRDDIAIPWSAYYELIAARDRHWLSTGFQIHIFDHPTGSYLQEVEACQAAFDRCESYAVMLLPDRKLVAGWGPDTTGYFGRMGAAGRFKNLTREAPAELARYLDLLPRAGAVSAKQLRQILAGLDAVHGVSIPTASRLLAMKRPDLFLAVDAPNRKRLRAMFHTGAKNVEE